MRDIKCWTWEELANEENIRIPEFLVDGLMGKDEFTLLSATAKTGKTWLGLHLALSVASGLPFLGKYATKKGKVLIIQTEIGLGQFRDRIQALLENNPEYDTAKKNLLICKERLQLDTVEGQHQLISTIMEHSPTLLVLDPLYTFHRKDENVAKDMVPILVELKGLAQKFNTAVFLIHHEGKRQEMTGARTGFRSRGSSALADVPDNLWSLTRPDPQVLLLAIEARNIPPPGPIRFQNIGDTSFKLIEGCELPKGSVTDLLALMPHEGQIKKTDLISKINSAFGFRLRKAEELISTAKKMGKLASKQVGKEVAYYLHKEDPHVRIPLGTCESADEEMEAQWACEEESAASSIIDVGF